MQEKSKHIALFIPSLSGGGAEKVILHLAEYFNQKKIKVDLIVGDAQGELYDQIPKSVRLIDLKKDRMFSTLPVVLNYLRKENPDVLLAALNLPNIVAVAAKILSGSRTTVATSIHTVFPEKKMYSIKEQLENALTKISYHFSDIVVAVSYGAADYLVQYLSINPDKITVIYNPVLNSKFYNKSNVRVAHKFFTKEETEVILGVGRLTLQKDFETLIRAFNIVRKVKPAKLIILGEGDQRENLESMVKELRLTEHISLPGFVINPNPYMKKASVFVLSSAWEGLGNVIIEALACGCPVISTNCQSGPSEILKGGKYGKLVPVGDFSSMADSILEVLNNGTESINDNWLAQFSQDYSGNEYLKLLFDN